MKILIAGLGSILLEKPFAEDLSCVDELRQAAAQNGNRILVGLQIRYHPTLQKAKEMIETGVLGKILTVHAHWGEYLPNWHPWEDYRQSYASRDDLGGGVIRTLTHPLDYLRYLLDEVESLWAFKGHIATLEDGVRALELALAARKSSLTGYVSNF